MDIAVLGPLRVDHRDTSLGRRDRVVLSALALRPGMAMSSDRLLDALWGDDPPASASKNLQGCVVRLRKLLGTEAIQTSPMGYRLAIPFDEVDAQRFERMVRRSRELLSLGEPDRAAYLAGDALALWRGQPYIDLEGWDLGTVEAGRLEELRLDAEEIQVDASLRAGRFAEVLADAEAMVQAAPMRERRWALLALAQYQAGRQGEALRTIHQVKTLLVERLGLDPGPELASLEQAILRQDDALMVDDAIPTSSTTCPYRGLTPYDVGDSEEFFGRDAELADCLALLRSKGVVAVVGPSGCGKSSLVRAGVAASLTRDGQQVVVVTPGEHPLDALTGLAGRTVPALVVDQCEEVFSLCPDPNERRRFFAALSDHAGVGLMVVALRADRLSHVSAYPAIARLVERGLHLLGAMGEESLREAIEAPARQSGLLVEQGLVDLLVREVEGEPGALPLLSHALQETWQRREGNTLTVAGYRATGEIRGAVAQSAEDVYRRIAPEQRHIVRDLLLRMVTPGSEGEPVRSKIPRRLVVVDDPAQEQLIDMLVQSRLVTSDEGMVELAHEALAGAWPRLRAWLDDDIEGQRILHHLSGAADAWNSLGRPDSEVYRGVRLAQTLEWRDRAHPELTPTERDFLAAAERLAAHEEKTAVERARQQGRLIRRLRGVLGGAAVLLVAALIAGGVAVHQKGLAERSATVAEARRVAALALTEDDTSMSLLHAVAGIRLDDSPETRSSLLAVLAKRPELIASTPLEGDATVFDLDVSSDGRLAATYDTANRVRLYDIESGNQLSEFRAGPSRGLQWISGQVDFSPDGKTLAVVMAAPTRQPVMLLAADTLKPLAAQPAGVRGRWRMSDLAYSGDGHSLAATMTRIQGGASSLKPTSNWAFVWDLESPQKPTQRVKLEENNPVALSPDGRVLYTGNPFSIHDLSSGAGMSVDSPYTFRMTMSPDGRWLAASRDDGLLLFDPTTAKPERELEGGAGAYAVSFSQDSKLVATVTFDKEALVWDAATGRLRARFPVGDSYDVVDFGSNDTTVYTAGSDGYIRHWDIDGDRRFIARVAATPTELGDESFVQPAPGGDLIAYPNVTDDGTKGADALTSQVTFFDVRSGRAGPSVERGEGYHGAHDRGSWHPDSVHYALATGGEIRVWNGRTGELTAKSTPSGPEVSAIDYSTDGSRLVMGELSGQVTMLDSDTLTAVGRPVMADNAVREISAGPDDHTAIALTGLEDPGGFWVGSTTGWALVDLESGTILDEGMLGFNATLAAFSPDGRHATLAGEDGNVLVLDTDTGEPVRQPVSAHEGNAISLAYSPDGERILTAGDDGTVAVWDETGRLVARVVTSPGLQAAEFRDDPESVLMAPLFGGPVYEWDTRVDSAIAYACAVAGRDFTEAEWQETFGDRPYEATCPST